MRLIPIDTLIAACRNETRGTLREAFEGEEPDFIQECDKECTGLIMMKKRDEVGFSVMLAVPIFLEAGVGYVFEEA